MHVMEWREVNITLTKLVAVCLPAVVSQSGEDTADGNSDSVSLETRMNSVCACSPVQVDIVNRTINIHSKWPKLRVKRQHTC